MAALPKIRLKAEITDDLKAEVAKTKWGNVLSITPVVMTVIATMLAGLASSEMTSAQYDRSLAAQRQCRLLRVLLQQYLVGKTAHGQNHRRLHQGNFTLQIGRALG